MICVVHELDYKCPFIALFVLRDTVNAAGLQFSFNIQTDTTGALKV